VRREERFENLVRETGTDLLAYAARRARTAEDAADVVAETFLIAWRKIEKLPVGPGARLWVFGVARNVLRRGAVRDYATQAAVERLGLELRATIEPAPPADERSDALRSALERLPATQREAILLAAWEGLTPREIAVVTGAPVNLVRVRLHRARARLRQALVTESNRLSRGRVSPAPRAKGATSRKGEPLGSPEPPSPVRG
jgi:RNA polymerase sigma factor (sigma-70 family)